MRRTSSNRILTAGRDADDSQIKLRRHQATGQQKSLAAMKNYFIEEMSTEVMCGDLFDHIDDLLNFSGDEFLALQSCAMETPYNPGGGFMLLTTPAPLQNADQWERESLPGGGDAVKNSNTINNVARRWRRFEFPVVFSGRRRIGQAEARRVREARIQGCEEVRRVCESRLHGGEEACGVAFLRLSMRDPRRSGVLIEPRVSCSCDNCGGRGGFGSVVLCKNKPDGREYAVKKVRLSKDSEKNEKILRNLVPVQ